jgi:sugar lactone lactonase YvrE
MVGFATGATAAPKASFTTVATGFNNPRGLAFGEDGRLYVAEAGKGGPDCVSGGPGGSICPGLTGAVSVITRDGKHHPIVSGLASISDQGGIAATGPDGLSRSEEGGLYTIITSCPQQVDPLSGAFDPALVAAMKAQVGQVIKAKGNGQFQAIAGVGEVDWNWSLTHTDLPPQPNIDFPDCNPYGILAGEHDQWVVDAATNTLDHVKSNGTIEIVAFIPNPMQGGSGPVVSDAVPTCLDRGPDGALYIGELTGGGSGPKASVVWRVDTRQKNPKPTMWATGLTAVTGCGFGPDGKFYATEFSTSGFESFAPFTGAVVRVPAHSTSPIPVVEGLSFPNGFAARGGSIYVSNWSIVPAVPPGPPFQPGEVVRISLHGGDD